MLIVASYNNSKWSLGPIPKLKVHEVWFALAKMSLVRWAWLNLGRSMGHCCCLGIV